MKRCLQGAWDTCRTHRAWDSDAGPPWVHLAPRRGKRLKAELFHSVFGQPCVAAPACVLWCEMSFGRSQASQTSQGCVCRGTLGSALSVALFPDCFQEALDSRPFFLHSLGGYVLSAIIVSEGVGSQIVINLLDGGAVGIRSF